MNDDPQQAHSDSTEGGPSLALMTLLLKKTKSDRGLAEHLLHGHPLVEAIEMAAAQLRHDGREADALVLDDLAVPFRTWPIYYQQRLRDAGLRAIASEYDVRIFEDPDDGAWFIEYIGKGRIALRVPKQHRCEPTSLTEEQLKSLYERAEQV